MFGHSLRTEALSRIQVVLVGMSKLQRTLLKSILDQPDIRVLEIEEPSFERFPGRAQVVIQAADPPHTPEGALALLAEDPRLKVLAIERGGQATQLYELTLTTTEIANIEAQHLLALLRRRVAAGWRREPAP